MQESHRNDAQQPGGSRATDASDVSTEGAGGKEIEDQEALSFGQMLASTMWAALGVQNKKNRERDFTRGKATHFIFFGIGFTVLFVLGMYTLVSFVLSAES